MNTISAMPEQQVKELLSKDYLGVIASRAGFKKTQPAIDNGVDLAFTYPMILVIFILPADKNNWMNIDVNFLVMRKNAFWNYPAIHAHFENYREKLIRRDDQGKYFWDLRSCKYWQEFEQAKIVIPAIAQDVQYAPDFISYYSNDKTSICVVKNVKMVAGLLNSKLLWWFVRQVAAARQHGFYEFKPLYVTSIPITTGSQTGEIERLVDQILAIKENNPNADVSSPERKIDQVVYQLYDLTAEEITVVEGQKE